MIGLPSSDQLRGQCKQQMGVATIAWGNFTDNQRLINRGQALRLAGLLQVRYAFSRDEADAQVKAFIEKSKLS